MKMRHLTRPIFETLEEIDWIYTSDPHTDEEIEVSVFSIKSGADLARALNSIESPELRGAVSDRLVVGADSWKVVHDQLIGREDPNPESPLTDEPWKAMVYLYPDGVAIAPRTQFFTQIPVGQTAHYLKYHPILQRIYNMQQVPIIEPKGGIR